MSPEPIDRDDFRRQVRIDTGRADGGGTFVRVVHVPTGRSVVQDPIGTERPLDAQERLLEQLRIEIQERPNTDLE